MAQEEIKYKAVLDAAKAAKSASELKKSLKDIKNELGNVEEGSQAFLELSAAAGQAKDKLSDMNEQIAALEDGGSKLQAFTSLGAGIAGSFGIATGAAALFGKKNEDVEKVMLKIHAVMAITQGLQSIADAQKQAGIIKNIALLKLQELETKKGIVATQGMSVAQRLLNLILKQNPFILILTAVIALIGIFAALKDKVKIIGDIFSFLGEIVDALLAPFKAIGEALGFIATEAEKNSQAVIDNTDKEIQAIQKRYDRELKLAKASGADTAALEKEKTQAEIDRINSTLAELAAKKEREGELEEEEQKKFEELQEQKKDLITDLQVFEIEAAKKVADEKTKAAEEAAKQAEEDKKKQEEAYKAAVERAKNLADTELEIKKNKNTRELEEIDAFEANAKLDAKKRFDDKIAELTKQGIFSKERKLEFEKQYQFELANIEEDANKKRTEKQKEVDDILFELQVRQNERTLGELQAKAVNDAAELQKEFDERIADLKEKGLLTEELQTQLQADLTARLTQLETDKNKQIAQLQQEAYTEIQQGELDRTAENIQAKAAFEKEQLVLAFDEKIATLREQGALTAELEAALRKEQNAQLAEIDKQAAQEELDNFQRKQEARKQIATDSLGLVTSLGELFLKDAQKQEKAKKAIAIAGLAADTASAIGSLVKYANANPLNGVTFGAAGIAQYISGLAQIIGNIAKAKSILNGGGASGGSGGGSGSGGSGGATPVNLSLPNAPNGGNLFGIGGSGNQNRLLNNINNGVNNLNTNPTRSYVVESDISGAQDKNRLIERRATF